MSAPSAQSLAGNSADGSAELVQQPAREAMPLAEAGQNVSQCVSCKKPVNEENAVVVTRQNEKASEKQAMRCQACHALKARISRLLSKHGNVTEDWTNVTAEEKKAFYANSQNLYGPDLLCRMQETITESKRTSSTVSFEGTGEYFDEVDMKKKYHDKPEQLQSVLANTMTYFCPVRQVLLYEDVKYKRTVKDTEERSKTEKRKIQVIPTEQSSSAGLQETGPKNKKVKGDPQAEEEALPKLKAGQKKKLTKKLETMNTKKLQLMDWICKARAEQVRELVPSYVLDSAGKLVDAAVDFGTECEGKIRAGYGDHEELLKALDSFCEELVECQARVKCQVEQAQAHAAHAGRSN